MQLQVQNATGNATVDVADAAFGREFKEALVHQVVTAFLAGARAGTKGQKSRSDVSGGGRKPFRQKGTGRARAGTIRSPLWRSGGVTFAASNRDHSQKVNKKMYRGAMGAILSELVRQERLVVVEDLAVSAPKTKELVGTLAGLGVSEGLIVAEGADDNLYLAARNLPKVGVTDVAGLDPVSLVGSEKVVINVAALRKIEEWLA